MHPSMIGHIGLRAVRLAATLAAALALTLGASQAARAAFVYELNVLGDQPGSFRLTVDALIATTTTFAYDQFDDINPLPGTPELVRFEDPFNFISDILYGSGRGWFFQGGLDEPGTYCAGGTCTGTEAILTIREVAPVPEPSTYALMVAGLGLLAAVAARRRSRGAAPS